MSLTQVDTSKECRIGKYIIIGTADIDIAKKTVEAYRKIEGIAPTETINQVVVGLAVTVDGVQCYVSVDPAAGGRDE